MDPVHLQFVQNAGVMCNDQARIVPVVKFADTTGHDLHRIHIQAGIRFIQQRQFRPQHQQLQYLIALLLPAGKPYI